MDLSDRHSSYGTNSKAPSPMRPFIDEEALYTQMNENFSRVRDISLRDGVQSWDGNKIPTSKLLPIARALDDFVKKGKEMGIAMPSAEMFGGGQFLQPAKFMGEDPFINMKELHEVTQHIDKMALIRGRQGLGFTPVSAEILGAMIEGMAERGTKVFRVFDMMNDIRNVKPTFEALKAYKKQHGKDGIIVEGAISYMSPPDKDGRYSKGQRAMTLKEYGAYAVEMAKLGADEITIKNYAGVGDKEMPELIQTIRSHVDAAGFGGMKVNLHDHGQKPEVLWDALQASADKVDVGIGLLSGGPSHTDMRSTMYYMLKQQGYDVDQRPAIKAMVDKHPLMRRLAIVENAIEKVITQETGKRRGEKTSFKKKRAMLETVTQEDNDRYRVAGGALSDLSGRIDERYKNGQPKGFPEKKEYFDAILAEATNLWEKAGQFNTVTPGAKILLEQAMIATDQRIYGKKMTLDKYSDDYVDIAVGRYGLNRGMEKGRGDTKWRDTMLMYRTLKALNASLEGEVRDEQLAMLMHGAQLSSERERLIVTRYKGIAQIDLRDPALEEKLNQSDINLFRKAVAASRLDDKVKSRLVFELSTDRSPDPAEGLAEGHRRVAALKEKGLDVNALHAAGQRISSPKDMALLAMLVPEDVFTNVVSTVKNSGPFAKLSADGKSHLAQTIARAAERVNAGSTRTERMLRDKESNSGDRAR